MKQIQQSHARDQKGVDYLRIRAEADSLKLRNLQHLLKVPFGYDKFVRLQTAIAGYIGAAVWARLQKRSLLTEMGLRVSIKKARKQPCPGKLKKMFKDGAARYQGF